MSGGLPDPPPDPGQPPLRVLVVDDEALARARLVTLLGQCSAPAARVLAQASNATDALALVQQQTFDLALVDVQMPAIDGRALARSLAALPHPPALVFVTAHAGYAVEAFELDALDYLTKPVRQERLQAALQKVERKAHNWQGSEGDSMVEEVLVIQDRHRTERLPLAAIVYFKAELKYITVRTALRSYVIDGALNELEEKYATRFLRIHRNALIARRAARALERHYDPEEGDGWALRLDGIDDVLFVSRRQLAAVRDLLARGLATG